MNNRVDHFALPRDRSRGAETFRQACAEMGLEVSACRTSLGHLDRTTRRTLNDRWEELMYRASGVSPDEMNSRKLDHAQKETRQSVIRHMAARGYAVKDIAASAHARYDTILSILSANAL